MNKKGKRLISKRILKNLSQQELSDLCGISRTSLSGWEKHGLKRARKSNLLKVASVLGCDIEDII
jgi:transcriptional regulator with XRE-family HTH domain